MAEEKRTQFDYLLNAFEAASQSNQPAAFGYAAKRKALYAYVRDLEHRAVRPTDLSDPQLKQLCAALGWQGGTFHQAVAEVERLRAHGVALPREGQPE